MEFAKSTRLVLALLCLFSGINLSRAEDTIKIMAVGDMMLGTSYPDTSTLPPDNENILIAAAGILRKADIAIGNLEGAMTDGGVTTKCESPRAHNKKSSASPEKKRCFAFRMPTRYAEHIAAAGFNVMTLANNHALDFGMGGLQDAYRALDQNHIAHTGMIGDIAHLEIKGKKIAVIGFSTYTPMHNLNHLAEVRRIIKNATKDGEWVIVVFHGGAEGGDKIHTPQGREMFLGENRGDLRAFARAAIDSGALLVIGHGPHVPRGMEFYRGRLIAYSLGNFATYRMMNLEGPRALAPVLEVNLAPDGSFQRGIIHSLKQTEPGIPEQDPEDSAVKLIQRVSHEDFGKNAPHFDGSNFCASQDRCEKLNRNGANAMPYESES